MSVIKDIFLWLYWHPLKTLIQKIPVRLAYGIGRLGGRMLYIVAVRRRHDIEREYRLIVSNATLSSMERSVKNTFINRCLSEIEMMLYSEINEKNIHQFVTCSSFDTLEKALSVGKGVMLLFAHFGPNQMVMPAIGYSGYRMCQMSAPATVWLEKLPNRRFSDMEKLSLQLRWAQELSLPVTHINIFGSLRRVLSCLKQNEILGVAIDGGGGKERIEIKLMDKPALFAIGAANLAIRTGCVILPTFMVRTKSGPSQMIILSAIHPPANASQGDAIRSVTQEFADRMTQFVREYPDHYLDFMVLRRHMNQLGEPPLFIDKDKSDGIDYIYYPYTA
ncbi:MAG: lysophospholipid acyltransferase family protein [Deltaproteobacteria bacterium]|nr:lysophospholipid acyltransferase family protein [Deltaproteobacteria bacterium]